MLTNRSSFFSQLLDEPAEGSDFPDTLCENGTWITADLGGYPSNIEIQDFLKPQQKTESQTLTYESQQQQDFEKQLETWERTKQVSRDGTEWIYHLLHNEQEKTETKHLLELPENAINKVYLSIEAYAKENHHPIYHIHSPDDLVCSAPYLKSLPNGKAQLVKGPGGPLHTFLNKTSWVNDNTPLLVVNYANFSADDIVRLNGLVDDIPMADNTPVPKGTHIIGLIDPQKPGSYCGEDFYSRLPDVQICPHEIFVEHPSFIQPLPENVHDCVEIELGHGTTWEMQCLGGWVVKAGALSYEEGVLTEALKSGKPIVLNNPPNDPKFELFWKLAQQLQGFWVRDTWVPLSTKHAIYHQEGYRWDEALTNVLWQNVPKESARILNPTLLNQMLGEYRILDNKLTKCSGILEQFAYETLGSVAKINLDQERSYFRRTYAASR